MLLLKLFLVPLFLGLISLGGRRWGPAVAGWLAGLPVVSGPILLLLAFEQGSAFASASAIAAVSAVIALLAFGLAYAWCALRAPWPIALVCGWCAWFLVAALLASFELNAFETVALTLALLLAVPFAYPRVAATPASSALPHFELAARMLAGGLLTVTVTALSARIGARWSGLFAVFPVIGSVLAAFSQRAHGAGFVAQLLKGNARGLYALVAFAASLAALLPRFGIAAGFLLALLPAGAAMWASHALSLRVRETIPAAIVEEGTTP